MRVDAHHHLWDASDTDQPWMDGPWADPLRDSFDAARLAPLAEAAGITATIAVQAVADVAETRALLAVPELAGVVGWVDLTADGVADTLAELRDPRLVGIRHQVQDEPDPRWLLRADVLAGLRAVGAAGLVYDLLVTPVQLPAAIGTARALPEVSFVLDHLGKPDISEKSWQPWADALTALAALPNVTAKVSGLVTEADWAAWTPADLAPYLRHALDTFGPDRLMFGSDWPVCTLAATYAQVVAAVEAALSETERDKVFGDTARRVYGLEG